MSYILDALKKLERKRQREGMTGMISGHDTVTVSRSGRRIWPYVIVAALVLNAVILVWWLRPWHKTGKVVATQQSRILQTPMPQNPVTAQTPQQNEINVTERPPLAAQEARKTLSAPVASDEVQSRETVQPVVPDNVSLPADRTVGRRTKVNAYEDSKDMTDRNPAPSGKTVPFDDLPESVKQGLPAIDLGGHYYSDKPDSRLVMMNGRMIREGQTTQSGIKLEKITPDGVIMSYQGYRFSKPVFGP